MKIIELLNKIANGEEIPKKIKYSNKIYEFKDSTFGTGYLYEDKGIRYWFSEDVLSDSAEELNYEVEIIEDEELKMFEQEWFDEKEGTMSIVEVDLAVKINEIIKKVNSIEQK